VTIRVLLADDEPLARRRLERLLRDQAGVSVVAVCENGQSALAALRAGEVDLALLDVQMPDLDGFGVVAEYGAERMPSVIFVTAFDQYAIRAFEVHALDYLLKPVTSARFQSAFRRARTHLQQAASAERGRRLHALLAQMVASGAALDSEELQREEPGPNTYTDRLLVRAADRSLLIRVTEVDWFEADRNYVRVHVARNTHLLRESIATLAESLDPAQFARIHRSTVVNLDRIRELQPWFGGDLVVILKDGTRLRLSRTYRNRLPVLNRTR
jgi:two-component system LytT family response regulator